jgi:uncharacterized BrkB/YihY/UPF0761 family membrane protein
VKTPLENKPNVGVRMLLWFGIYFGAQLPLIAYYPFITLFPAGLISAYISPFLPAPENDYFPVLRCGPAVILGYVFYLVHFLLTLVMSRPHAFRILIRILIVAVIVNFTGCAMSVDFNLFPPEHPH